MRRTIEFLETRIALAVDVSLAVTTDVVAETGVAQVEVRITNESAKSARGVDIEVITSLESAAWRRSDEPNNTIVFDPIGDRFEGSFGTAFSATTNVGDLNGDSVPDIGTRFGQSVRVFLGSATSGPSASQESDVLLSAGEPWLELNLHAVGDFNDDGVDDLMIVARETPDRGKGRIYVVYGGGNFQSGGQLDLSSLDGSNGFVMAMDQSSLVGGAAGDFNGDGVDDLVAGVTYETEGFAELYVVFGGSNVVPTGELDLLTLDTGTGFVLESFEPAIGPFGPATGIGDTNGDGFDDLAVFGLDGLVLYGGQEGFLNVDEVSSDNGYFIFSSDNAIGSFVSAAGDMNGDGLADFVLSSRAVSDVLVVFGSSESPEFLDVADEGEQHRVLTVHDLVGATQGEVGVAGVGNFNGDSYDDIAIGSPGLNGDAGGAYVIFGGPDLTREMSVLDLSADEGLAVTAGREIMREWFYGINVSGLGDTNNDGLDDVGATLTTGGRSPFVLYGRSNNGTGDFSDSISELEPGESATYIVTGQVLPGGFTIAVDAFTDQEDSNPDNNRLSLTEAKLDGDVNLDGRVTFADFLVISENFGQSSTSRLDGDLNDDALISFEDFLILANDFGRIVDDLV